MGAPIPLMPGTRDQHWFVLGAQRRGRASVEAAMSFPGPKLPALSLWQPLGSLKENKDLVETT